VRRRFVLLTSARKRFVASGRCFLRTWCHLNAGRVHSDSDLVVDVDIDFLRHLQSHCQRVRDLLFQGAGICATADANSDVVSIDECCGLLPFKYRMLDSAPTDSTPGVTAVADELDSLISRRQQGESGNPEGIPSIRSRRRTKAAARKATAFSGVAQEAGDRGRTGDVQLGKEKPSIWRSLRKRK